jgi:uncharacterized protein with PIN domain
MSVKRATYLDSSAIVKLVVHEPESAALSRYLRGRRPIVASALAQLMALAAFAGDEASRGRDILTHSAAADSLAAWTSPPPAVSS